MDISICLPNSARLIGSRKFLKQFNDSGSKSHQYVGGTGNVEYKTHQ